MIKELIEHENFHKNEAKKLSIEILDKLEPIFENLKTVFCVFNSRDYDDFIQKEYKFKFYMYSKFDGYRIDGHQLRLHYTDTCYDIGDTSEFVIPLSIVEKELSENNEWAEGAAVKWYDKIYNEARKKKFAKDKKKEEARKLREIAKQKKLKKKKV